MKSVFTLLLPNGETHQEKTSIKYELIDREISSDDIYHPLNTLRKCKITGKFIDEMTEEDKRKSNDVIVNAIKNLLEQCAQK